MRPWWIIRAWIPHLRTDIAIITDIASKIISEHFNEFE